MPMSGSVRCKTMDWIRLAPMQYHNIENSVKKTPRFSYLNKDLPAQNY
jgi:hypothetical protein